MRIKRYILLAGLVAGTMTTAGCHGPALSSMKPDAPKLAVGIVGSKEFSGSKELTEYTKKLLEQQGVVFDVRSVDDDAKAAELLSVMSANKNIDLLLTDSKYGPKVNELAKTNGMKKFGLIGADASSDQQNVRINTINREHQSFVAGYLTASSLPQDQIGVILNKPRTSQDAEWKGLLEGIHYAGQANDPVVMTIDEIMGKDGIEKIKSKKPRVFIVLDPLSEGQLAKIHESGKWLFSLHDLPKMYPSIIARPTSLLMQGVQEQSEALVKNAWKGNFNQPVMGTTYFELLKPDALPGANERKKTVEDALRNHTIQPEQYITPPKQEKKSAQ